MYVVATHICKHRCKNINIFICTKLHERTTYDCVDVGLHSCEVRRKNILQPMGERLQIGLDFPICVVWRAMCNECNGTARLERRSYCCSDFFERVFVAFSAFRCIRFSCGAFAPSSVTVSILSHSTLSRCISSPTATFPPSAPFRCIVCATCTLRVQRSSYEKKTHIAFALSSPALAFAYAPAHLRPSPSPPAQCQECTLWVCSALHAHQKRYHTKAHTENFATNTRLQRMQI